MNCSKCGSGYKGMCPVTFGLALGLTSGLFMMLMAWSAMWWGFGADLVMEYGRHLSGYEATFLGGLIGGLWGLAKGFVFGFVFILMYNLLCCCKTKCCKKEGACSTGGCGSQGENK